MRHLLGKLRFIHGRLWRQDAAYRFAALIGPAPLLGGILAGAIWGGFLRFEAATYRPPPWALRPSEAPEWVASPANPVVLTPAKPLPPIGPDGVPLGYTPGWNVALAPIE